jgi:glyoxylase-like metal-dependent hydrolase (beta-lactamase superfamily II)
MKQYRKFAAIVISVVMVVLGHGQSVLAQADKDKAESQKSPAPKGYYIMEGREDMMKAMEGQISRSAEIMMVRVAEGINMLTTPGMGGSNMVASVGSDGVLLIDDGFPELTDATMGEIRKLTDKPVRFVLNTHWHWDHAGGNENMAKAGATIIAQESVMPWMTTWQISGMDGTPKAPQPPKGLPVITFKDEITVRFNGQTIVFTNAGPAHSDGDAIVHFAEADVYVMGDIYLTQSYPFIDLNTGGNIKGYIAAVDKVLAKVKPDTIIIPGHGGISKGSDLKEYRDMIITLCDRVQTAINEGKTLDEIIAMKPTADLDKKWSNPVMIPSAAIKFVYVSLTKGTGR